MVLNIRWLSQTCIKVKYPKKLNILSIHVPKLNIPVKHQSRPNKLTYSFCNLYIFKAWCLIFKFWYLKIHNEYLKVCLRHLIFAFLWNSCKSRTSEFWEFQDNYDFTVGIHRCSQNLINISSLFIFPSFQNSKKAQK